MCTCTCTCTCMCMCMCMCMSMCMLTWLCVCDVCCGVYVVLWCCVFCWWCVVWCGVVLLCGVVRLGMRKTPPCAFKTPPCVPGKRPHVQHRAFSWYTRRRRDRTHGGVLNAHTEGFSAFSVFLALSLLSPLFSSLLFSLSNNDNDHSSSRALSQYTRPCLTFGPECMYLGTLFGEHVRIMQETIV